MQHLRTSRAPSRAALALTLTALLGLAACNTPPTIVQGPLTVPPVMPPSPLVRPGP